MRKIEVILLGSMVLGLLGCDFGIVPPNFGESVAGQGSTLARFAIEGDDLYIIDNQSLRHFDISTPSAPEEGERITVDFEVKSIFAYNDHLFMSNETGLNIYDVSDGDAPQFVSNFSGITACNSVVFQGNAAFVTRRRGDECGWTDPSELAVLDVSDFSSLNTLRVYSGTNTISSPVSLAVSPNTLFLCEGNNGLRIYQSTVPDGLVQTGHRPNFEAFGLVPNGSNAIIKGSDGLYQYDISNPLNLRFLSRIPFVE